MSISRSAGYALGVLAGAALIAGCSGGTESAVAPASMANAARGGADALHLRGGLGAFAAVRPYGTLHPDHRKSWVSPDAKEEARLMFASDAGLGDVYIYALPSMTLKGTLTGFSQPQGLCSDTSGNVYIANTNATQVLKYSRAGTLLSTYSDAYGYPVGCAVDPATGNLAVANIFGFTGAGQVLVFSSPSSSPKVLTNRREYYYYYVGYGPGSSLWVSGKDSSNVYMLSGCGASSCSTIKLSGGKLYFPGAVQWDSTHATWVAFDQLCGNTTAACSYPVSAKGVLGTATSYSSHTGGAICDLIQGDIAADHHKYVVGGDYEYCGGGTASSYDRWGYAGGGKPTAFSSATKPYSVPAGVTVSTK
jgi:hypothetical protein